MLARLVISVLMAACVGAAALPRTEGYGAIVTKLLKGGAGVTVRLTGSEFGPTQMTLDAVTAARMAGILEGVIVREWSIAPTTNFLTGAAIHIRPSDAAKPSITVVAPDLLLFSHDGVVHMIGETKAGFWKDVWEFVEKHGREAETR